MKHAPNIRGPKSAFAGMAAYACVMLVSLLAGCNNGFSVLTESDLKYLPVAKCAVLEPTLSCTVPLPDAQVCGHQPLIFSDSDPSETYHQVSLDRENWVQAVSGVTVFSDIPGFVAVPCESNFTFYMKGETLCNNIEVGVEKLGVTLSITAPSAGASVCGNTPITFTDSDTLETTHQASVDKSTWTTFTSGMALSAITEFSGLSNGSVFMLYIRGNDTIDICNHAEVASLTKIGSTITISSPSSGATVEGTDTVTFSDTVPFNTHDLRINSGAWLDGATSSVTTLSEIPGFSALSTGDTFTIYVRGDDNPTCNIASVSVQKGGSVTFDYNKTIVLDATGMGLSGNVINFPVLIRLRSGVLAETEIVDAVRAGAPDIRFYSATHGWLDYEIERWDQANNVAEVWVLFPLVLSSITDQFTMYYGNATVADGQNPSGVFSAANGYAGVWHLGETPTGTSGDIIDSSSNGIDGTSSGMVAGNSIPGQVGNGLNFRGTIYGDMVSMGANTLLQPDSITLSFWIKRTSTWDMAWGPLYAKESWSNPIGWQYYFDYNGVDSIGASLFIDGTNYFYIKQDPNTYYPNDTWVFMTLTFNTTLDTGAIYKNGVSQSVLISGVLSTITDSILTETKIAQDDNETVFWPGQMDELRISSVARSADWVKLCYENQKAGQSLVTIQP